jgi:transglutaminase-like putative cysteine protease
VLIATILASGCTSGQTATSSTGDALLFQGEREFKDNNINAAERLFTLAQENFTAAGDKVSALKARDRAATARMMLREFYYNRSQMESMIDQRFPGIPADRKAGWLPCDKNQCINSDGEAWYFDKTIKNIEYHNMDIMRGMTTVRGETPFYDQVRPYVAATAVQGAGNYVNPIKYEGTEVLTIPAAMLPKSGTLRLWVPLPIETDSQRDVTIISVEPAGYVKSQTTTKGDIGFVYLEVPLESRSGDFLNITAKFRFTSYEQRFVIDPAKVGSYNTSDPEYLKYTASGTNIVVTPEIAKKAQEIVGNETNPYKKAQKIYWHVIDRPYSLVPHSWLDATNTPESVYVLNTGYGDCGSQSMYFAALCRAVGIPARAVGGGQIISVYQGGHFWSEYFLPGYGWIPNDVTIAEGGDWSFNATDAERLQHKRYYSGNLDPFRYIIQKDVDIQLVPDTGEAKPVNTLQDVKAICDTCTVDPRLGLVDNWKTTFEEI